MVSPEERTLTLKLAIGMQSNPKRQMIFKSGFTLLEILIVIVIVGITLTFALLAFGDFGSKRRIIVAAEQFANYVKLAQQQAILEAGTMGVKLHPDGYRVMRYTIDGYWQNISDQGIFAFQSLPSTAHMQWQTSRESKKTPDIIITASGDMTPFSVIFSSNDKDKLVTIEGNHDGHIRVY